MLSTTKQARDKIKRFSSVNEIDLKQFLIDKDSKNTQNATKVAFLAVILNRYCMAFFIEYRIY